MSDHIHILGICGTFMGGLALLARESGFSVTGSDRNIYPPMSTQLLNSDIPLVDGYDAEQLSPAPGCVVVGNALSRGQPVVEAMLNSGIPYTSGPEWLGRHILQNQWVLAVSGTHGKTSTASMLAWILESAGLEPGFLIGGIPSNFGVSARLGSGRYFVVEADEYDSAFFDKRSKFVHYRPNTLVINNLEYDHADIFPDLAAIETQFHHLVRCIPGDGLIVRGGGEAIDRVLDKGCWTPVETVAGADDEQSAGWTWRALSAAADALHISAPDGSEAELRWELIGPDKFPTQLRLRTIRRRNVQCVRGCGQRAPGPTGALLIIGPRDGLDRSPTAFVQHPVDRLAATAHNQPVAGNTSHQMMELGLDCSEVWENIRVIVFEVIDHKCVGSVMHEL